MYLPSNQESFQLEDSSYFFQKNPDQLLNVDELYPKKTTFGFNSDLLPIVIVQGIQ